MRCTTGRLACVLVAEHNCIDHSAVRVMTFPPPRPVCAPPNFTDSGISLPCRLNRDASPPAIGEDLINRCRPS